MISVAETDDALFAKLKKCGVPDEELDWSKYTENGLARYCLFKGGQSLVRIKRVPKTPKEYSSLHHEIFHVVASVFWKIGIKLKVKVSDEAYAYCIGYLTEEIYKRLYKN